MDITKSREDFEAWFDSRYAGILALPYFKLVEVTAMEAWQASRESIEVELPKHCERYNWSDGAFNFKQDTIEALRTAGIRIKGESE